MANKSRNETGGFDTAELLSRIWKEQYNTARRYVLAAQKRGRDKDRFQVEGVHFMILALRDLLVSFTPFKTLTSEVEADYATFTDLIKHF
jgi:hypothetical protein